MKNKKIKSVLIVCFAAAVMIGCADQDDAQKPKGDPVPTGPSSNGRVAACSGYFYDSYYGTQYYIYSPRTINITAGSTTISAYCTPYDVPNRFSLRNGAGNLVASSGWIGTANYPGPWGMSLNNGSPKTISASVGSSTTFTLEVETVPGGGLNDAWEASIGCN